MSPPLLQGFMLYGLLLLTVASMLGTTLWLLRGWLKSLFGARIAEHRLLQVMQQRAYRFNLFPASWSGASSRRGRGADAADEAGGDEYHLLGGDPDGDNCAGVGLPPINH